MDMNDKYMNDTYDILLIFLRRCAITSINNQNFIEKKKYSYLMVGSNQNTQKIILATCLYHINGTE